MVPTVGASMDAHKYHLKYPWFGVGMVIFLIDIDKPIISEFRTVEFKWISHQTNK